MNDRRENARPEGDEITAQSIGRFIGRAIANDVLSNPDWPDEWTGIDAQDADQIPKGIDRDQVEVWAEMTYGEMMSAYGAAVGR